MSRRPTREDYLRLRAEWLQYKNQVFDSNTGLPTLDLLLDDVRRLLERAGSVILVYLDLSGDTSYEAACGWHAYDELLRGFARTLLRLREELVPRPELIGTLAVRSDKFVLFLAGTGQNGRPVEPQTAGVLVADVQAHIRERFPARAQEAIAGPPALRCGHALIHRNSRLHTEKAVHEALDEARGMSLQRHSDEQDRRVRALDAVIAEQRVGALFQPIVHLHDRSVLGFEALGYGLGAGAPHDARELKNLAENAGRLADLERVFRQEALAAAHQHLQPGHKLFINASSAALRDPEVDNGGLLHEVRAAGLAPEDVVIEITERVTTVERAFTGNLLHRLKAEGFGLAMDDMGVGYSNLQAIADLEPDYLKFHVSFVRGINHSRIKRSLLETLVDLARHIGARTIAEGIEAEAELKILATMGVTLGQGRHLTPRQASAPEKQVVT